MASRAALLREGLGHALVEPAGGAVEALRRCAEAVARQRDLLVAKDRRHQAGAGLVGMLGDPPHQRQRRDRRGQHQILPRLQLQPDLDGDLGEPVELDGIDRCRDVARV